MRSLAALMAVAMVAAAPVPASSPALSSDQAHSLTGSWTCRSPRGQLSRLRFSADGDGFVAEESASPVTAYLFPQQRYAPDGNDGWRITSDDGNRSTFVGTAPRWTGTTWNIDGTVTMSRPRATPFTAPQRVTYERLDAVTLKRLVSAVTYGQRTVVGEVCARGDDPPAAALCALPDVPADVDRAVEPDMPVAAQLQGISGAVRVLVSLDAEGRVTGMKIQSSASAVLDGSALAAAKLSAYRPALHDCAPVPGSYVFTVEYSH